MTASCLIELSVDNGRVRVGLEGRLLASPVARTAKVGNSGPGRLTPRTLAISLAMFRIQVSDKATRYSLLLTPHDVFGGLATKVEAGWTIRRNIPRTQDA